VVKHYIRVQKFFFIIWGLWVSKDAEFNVDFKNINLPKRQHAHKKGYSRKTNFNTTQGPPCVYKIPEKNDLSSETTFFAVFGTFT
jgi:hypothetical protein